MRRRVLSAAGWLGGWLINPAVAWGAVTGGGAVIWAALAGLPAVFVAIAFLAALAVGIAAAHYILVWRDRLRARKPQASEATVPATQGTIPAPVFNYTHEADKALQSIQEMFDEAKRRKLRLVEAELAAMIDEGKVLIGNPFDGNQPTREELAAWQEPLTKFVEDVLGPIELQRLLEVGPTFPNTLGQIDAIVGWLRQRRDNPSSWESRVGLDGPGLDAAIEARRGGQPKTLADQLDALMREGMELLDELMAPAQAEETSEGTWMLEFGEAPAEWSEKADAFYKKIKDLLVAENPALLPDLERGFNERLGIQRESIREAPASDGRSNAQKMLDFATETQRTPARIVEACLEGLSHARKAI